MLPIIKKFSVRRIRSKTTRVLAVFICMACVFSIILSFRASNRPSFRVFDSPASAVVSVSSLSTSFRIATSSNSTSPFSYYTTTSSSSSSSYHASTSSSPTSSSPAPTAAAPFASMPECQIPDLDPFDPSVAHNFNYDPIPPCAPWESPFLVRPPNRFQMKAERVTDFQKRGSYRVIEGRKERDGQEEEQPGPVLTFDVEAEVIVNGSFVRIQCVTKNNQTAVFFLKLPYRPAALARVKERRKTRYYEHEALSKPAVSTPSSPPSRPFHVHVLGIDSVSRSQSRRHLRKLRSYLLSPEIDAIEYTAYNKIGLNTNPNWAAMQTGWHSSTPGVTQGTMVENSQEYRLKYWTTRLSVCSFARTAHSFAYSGLLASLAPSTALTPSLVGK